MLSRVFNLLKNNNDTNTLISDSLYSQSAARELCDKYNNKKISKAKLDEALLLLDIDDNY